MSKSDQQSADKSPSTNELELASLDRGQQDDGGHANDQRRDTMRLPSREEILLKLDRMPGLIAMGVLPAARANSMRSIYHTILSNLDDTSRSGSPSVTDQDVVAVLRAQPELLNIFRPFLTPEQLELVVREASSD
jgi:hypothetical protein